MQTRSGAPHSTAGFSLVDVSVALLVLAVAVGALVGTMFTALRLDQVNESKAAANQALRTVLEDMKAQEFSTLYVAYNTSSQDDPDPKHDYKDALDLKAEIPAGACGSTPVAEVIFPEDERGALREDTVDPILGLPRDLNGDGVIDNKNHAADYKLLPVTVKLAWESQSGPQTVQLATVIRRR